jgi:hypothetical protein
MRTTRDQFESAATKYVVWGIVLWIVCGIAVAAMPILAPILFGPLLTTWRGMQLYAAKDAYDVNLLRAREDHWGEKGIDAHTGKSLTGMTGRIKPVHGAGSRTEADVLGSADDDVDLADLGEPRSLRPSRTR